MLPQFGPGLALRDIANASAGKDGGGDGFSHRGQFVQRPIAMGFLPEGDLGEGGGAVEGGDVDKQARFDAVSRDERHLECGVAADGVFAGERLVLSLIHI